MTNDVVKISENTKISKDIIQRIKNHMFYQEHKLLHGIKKFDADYDMAQAWQRLINNEFVESDLILLQHEFAESILMGDKIIDYKTAHASIQKIYNWLDAA
jgi:hypothetical protein